MGKSKNPGSPSSRSVNWKAIALAFILIAVICMSAFAYAGKMYYWALTRPYSYNEYAIGRSWLIAVENPSPRVSGHFDGDVILDMSENLADVYWSFQEERWCYDGTCLEDQIVIANETRITFTVEAFQVTPFKSWGVERLESHTENFEVYGLPPGSSIIFRKPDGDMPLLRIRVKDW